MTSNPLVRPGAPFELTEIETPHGAARLYKNALPSLQDVYRYAERFAERDFIVYEGERWSFGTCLGKAKTLSHALVKKFDIGPGDRVGLVMRNYPDWAVAFLAISGANAVPTLINSWGTGDDISYCLGLTECKLVIADASCLHRLASAGPVDIPVILVRPQKKYKTKVKSHDFDKLTKKPSDGEWPEQGRPDDPALILFTSGTTGRPKAALFSHRAAIAGLMNVQYSGGLIGLEVMARAQAAGQEISMPADFQHSVVSAFPLFHISGYQTVFLNNLATGGKVVMMHKWDPQRALELIDEEKATAFNGVAAMIWDLLNLPNIGDYQTAQLISLGGGGAAIPPQYVDIITQNFPNALPGTGYGLTEASGTMTVIIGRDYEAHSGSVGRAVPIMDIKLCDDDDLPVATGEVGEIWAKGPTLMSEYWNNKEATAEAITPEGWLKTGDLGSMDADGYLWIQGRKKDIVISGGENISCVEVEAACTDHPDIREAAAFGLPDERMGEALAVALVPRDGVAVEADDIKTFLSENLASFKVPKYIFVQQDPLPRNASGKVDKPLIRKIYLEVVSQEESTNSDTKSIGQRILSWVSPQT